MTQQNAQPKASLGNLKPVLREYLDLRADIKHMEKELKSLDEQVRPAIANMGKMQLDEWTFECKEMPGRKTLDKAALEDFLAQHGKSIADFEKAGKPYTQLRVTEAAVVL